jgi:hypothetical protein
MSAHGRKRASSEIPSYCKCSRCGLKVPYTSRRCIAVEDKNSNWAPFGKPIKLVNLCLKCLNEFYADQQIQVVARKQLLVKVR